MTYDLARRPVGDHPRRGRSIAAAALSSRTNNAYDTDGHLIRVMAHQTAPTKPDRRQNDLHADGKGPIRYGSEWQRHDQYLRFSMIACPSTTQTVAPGIKTRDAL